jgi:hypothetical protein
MKLHPILTALALSTLSLTRATPTHAASCGTENLLAGRKPSQSQDIKGELGLVTDGQVGAEGTVWDAPVGVVLETPSAQVTYDLGEPREISAIVVQADANDTYKVRGSLDGAPTSYKVLAELANVVDRGHGLRTRALEIPPTTVRYIRFGEGAGDNYFSLAEFAAYCKKPSPFPPNMKVVETPAAQSAEPAVAPAKDGGRSVLLLAAAALGLAWLAYRTLNRGKAGEKVGENVGDGGGPEAGGSNEPPPSEGTGGPTGPSAG